MKEQKIVEENIMTVDEAAAIIITAVDSVR